MATVSDAIETVLASIPETAGPVGAFERLRKALVVELEPASLVFAVKFGQFDQQKMATKDEAGIVAVDETSAVLWTVTVKPVRLERELLQLARATVRESILLDDDGKPRNREISFTFGKRTLTVAQSAEDDAWWGRIRDELERRASR